MTSAAALGGGAAAGAVGHLNHQGGARPAMKVLIEPGSGFDTKFNLVMTVTKADLDLRAFTESLRQRLTAATVLVTQPGTYIPLIVQHLDRELDRHVLLDEDAFSYLIQQETAVVRVSCEPPIKAASPLATEAPAAVFPVSSSSSTSSSQAELTAGGPSSPRALVGNASANGRTLVGFGQESRRGSRRSSTATPAPVTDTPKPPTSTFMKRSQGRSNFSNSPTLDGLPLDDEYAAEGLELLPSIYNKLLYVVYQWMFYWRILIGSLSFFDVAFCAATVVITRWCEQQGLTLQLNPSLFISLIVFPLSFSVHSAYQRREKALADLSTIKGSALHLFLLYREWGTGLGKLGVPFMQDSAKTMKELFTLIRLYLTCKYEPFKEYYLQGVYTKFADLAHHTEDLRTISELPAPLFTRPIHDLQQMIAAFEKLRVVTDYRTPASIRSFTKLFIVVLGFLLCPYFAWLSSNAESHFLAAYTVAGALPLLFTCLQNVQIQLENPFGNDHDDINLDYLRSIDTISHLIAREVADRRHSAARVLAAAGADDTAPDATDITHLAKPDGPPPRPPVHAEDVNSDAGAHDRSGEDGDGGDMPNIPEHRL